MIHRGQVLRYLQWKQESEGGYTGNDLTELAELLGVSSRGLRIRLSNWIKNDKKFAGLVYLGKEKPSITLSEFFEIEQQIATDPLKVKKGIYDDLQNKRDLKNLETIPKSTFYRRVDQILLSLYFSEAEYRWFESQNINLPLYYSVEENRDALSTVFAFSDLKTYGGANLGAIYERLMKAKEWFTMYQVDAMRFYPQILTKNCFLKNILNSIHPNQKLGAQAKLTFEIQAAFVVECMDLLIDKIIHKQGRMRQLDNVSRQKIENQLRKEALEKLRKSVREMATSSKIDSGRLREYSEVLVDEELLARIKLLKKHTEAYQSILKLLNDLTSNMTCGVKFHRIEAKTVYDLASGELMWDALSNEEKCSIARNPDYVRAIDSGYSDIIPVLAISRLIDYIRNGKITFEGSYYYQDLGKRIKNIDNSKNGSYLTHEILDQLIEGTFPIDTSFFSNSCTTEIEAADDEVPSSWVNLSDILKEASCYVRASNPTWFSEHLHLFKERTDGMFLMEYTEEEFAQRLYDSIGFLGRNFRYRDSENFLNLQYFLQRYVSDTTLRLEFKFIHRCIEQITNTKIEGVVIDTMGIEALIKSILSAYHGRYHTVGFSDLRAVSINMIPVYSGVCRSTDSEAMNIVEVIDEVREICGDSVHIYTGNGHTTTRISAGMAYLSHGVIAAGRLYHEPRKKLGARKIRKLRKNIALLNKIGKLLREEPALGRVMAMRKHIYVDGLNVRKMVEDLGYLILQNVSQTGISIDEICQAVERSNHLKKKNKDCRGKPNKSRARRGGIVIEISRTCTVHRRIISSFERMERSC